MAPQPEGAPGGEPSEAWNSGYRSGVQAGHQQLVEAMLALRTTTDRDLLQRAVAEGRKPDAGAREIALGLISSARLLELRSQDAPAPGTGPPGPGAR